METAVGSWKRLVGQTVQLPSMTHASQYRGRLVTLLAIAATLAGNGLARAQTSSGGTDLSIELVDPNVLRVCADPRNLPFTNEKGEGFENKLAELFAEKLQKKLDYTYFPQAAGFIRMTLAAHRCDVIMGYPQGDDLVQGTNPYYRTTYALVAKQGSGLDEVTTLGSAPAAILLRSIKALMIPSSVFPATCSLAGA